jgi:hypothetical protein
MKRLHARRVGLGFQWDARSWENAPAACERILESLGGRTVHWCLPAMPPDTTARKKASLTRMLRGRLEQGGDLLASLGFSGACHPLLNLDELAKETAWGVKNPWDTGLADLFGLPVTVLMPSVPDLSRPEAWKVYRANGFRLVGACVDPATRPVDSPPGLFPFLRLPAAGAGGAALRQARTWLGSAEDLFLVVDLSGVERADQVEPVLAEVVRPLLAEGVSLAPVPDGELSEPALPPRGWRADWTQVPGPLLHARLDAAAGLARRKRKRNEDYRDLLGMIGSGDAPARDAAEERGDGALLMAHMLGEVSLNGSLFDVRLSGGRFCGVSRKGRDLLPRTPARSYVRVSGPGLRPRAGLSLFRTVNSFSYERGDGTGLREELALDGQDGAGISVDYSFTEGSPLLSIAVRARLPRLPDGSRVEEYAPLLLGLRELRRGEAVPVSVAAPDGSESSVTLYGRDAPVLLPGASHRIRRADGGWIVLSWGPAGGSRWGLPSFRVARARVGWLLEVNPFGSFLAVPGAALSGLRQELTLHLGIEG